MFVGCFFGTKIFSYVFRNITFFSAANFTNIKYFQVKKNSFSKQKLIWFFFCFQPGVTPQATNWKTCSKKETLLCSPKA